MLPVQASATGGSGSGAVTYSSLSLLTCSVNATSGDVSLLTGSGNCIVSAAKAGDASYLAITAASVSIELRRAAQTALSVNGPKTATYGAADVQLIPRGGSGDGAVTFSAGEPGASTACSVTSGGLLHMTSGTGTCSVTATKAADGNYESVTSAPITVSPVKATTSISLGGLSHTYDGTAKGATATITPASLVGDVSISYVNLVALPMNAGSYAVLATLTNNDYQAPSASATLVIAQVGQAALSITGLNSLSYGGSSVALGTTGGSGTGAVTFSAGASTACSVTAAGSVTATSGTGSCNITAVKANDVNYLPVTSGVFSLTVSKASATLTFSGLNAIYDGTPKAVTVTSSPVVTGISVTYNGSATAPTNAGSYAVVATLNNANYGATPASGTLNIRYVQQNCFAAPIKSLAEPPTTSGITKGATVQVRCTLLNANGGVISNATGSLRVQDYYDAGAPVLSVPNAFQLSSGTYTYKLSTSGSVFVKGKFYRVTATWNDGSTTVGWFYLNK